MLGSSAAGTHDGVIGPRHFAQTDGNAGGKAVRIAVRARQQDQVAHRVQEQSREEPGRWRQGFSHGQVGGGSGKHQADEHVEATKEPKAGEGRPPLVNTEQGNAGLDLRQPVLHSGKEFLFMFVPVHAHPLAPHQIADAVGKKGPFANQADIVGTGVHPPSHDLPLYYQFIGAGGHGMCPQQRWQKEQ